MTKVDKQTKRSGHSDVKKECMELRGVYEETTNLGSCGDGESGVDRRGFREQQDQTLAKSRGLKTLSRRES